MHTPFDAPAAAAAYRAVHRREHIPARYSGPLHLTLTMALGSLGIALCVLQMQDVRPQEWLTVPAAFLYANLFEYVLHRGPMHHRWPLLGLLFERHSRQHHRFFVSQYMHYDSTRDYRAVLFPIPFVIGFFFAAGLPAYAVMQLIGGTNVAALFLATLFAYYLNYEILHFCYHTAEDSWIARLPMMGRLRCLHTAHHDPSLMLHRNFNITWPICDALFGTLHGAGEQVCAEDSTTSSPRESS